MRNRYISQKQVSTNIAAWKMDHEWRCTVFPMGNYVFSPPSHLTVNTAICWGHVSSRHGVLLFGDGLYTFYHGIHPHFASPAWGNGSLIDVTGTAVEEEAPIFLASAVFKMSGFILCKTRWWFQKCFNVYFYLGMICCLTNIFELGGSTTTSKTSGLIPPTKNRISW